MEILSINVGDRLGFYQALVEDDDATASQLADATATDGALRAGVARTAFSRMVYGVFQCRATDPIYPPPIGSSGQALISIGAAILSCSFRLPVAEREYASSAGWREGSGRWDGPPCERERAGRSTG